MNNRSDSTNAGGLVRLQKVLALHGHGSRRACEEFILEGRVEVDGQVVKKLGTKVDPESQKITVDGERIIQPRMQYFALNKPPGVLSTASDPTGRIRVIDMIKTNTRVYNVGRLDKSSEGLILVTNDGDLANRLTHPRYGIEKKYEVVVAGRPNPEKLKSLKKGIYLAEAFVQVSNIRIKKQNRDSAMLEIVLDEGRNREIRRILARIGHKVTQLRRIAIGPLTLGDLPLGSHRRLTATEVKSLKKAAANTIGSKSSGTRKKSAKRPTKKKSFTGSSRTGSRKATSRETGQKRNTTRKSSKRGAARTADRTKPVRKKRR